MAHADAAKAGVGIDPDRRAYHMFIRGGLTDDQINHIYGFLYDPETVGPSAGLDPRKTQEAALRFYDKPWDVDRHSDSRASQGRYSRPLMGHAATTTHRHQTSKNLGPRQATKAATRKIRGEKGIFQQKMATSTTTGTNPSAEELDDWDEEAGLETFLARESDWIHRDVFASNTPDSHVEEECSVVKSLYEAYLGYKEARDTLNQVRRGRGFWPVIAIPATLAVRSGDETFRGGKGKDSKGTTQRLETLAKSKGGKGMSSGKSYSKSKDDPLKQRIVSRTHCRLCGEEGHWE